jgi:NAD(P)-dependent dehydrogenase (short-subunit alcohol dehydrogenase family)
MGSVREHFGRVDLLFNNAGINIVPNTLEDIDSVDFQKVIDTNVTSCFFMAKAVMRLMSTQQPQGGRIINNGSISSHTPRPGSAPYTVSKHAVLGLTKCIALDGRKSNITCGQIDFGNVSSDMTNSVGGSAYSMSGGMPQANGMIMPEPCFAVEDAAKAVFAMASLPLEANVLNMTIMASSMPFVGRG